jgi:predicted nucleic acid-binding protein
LSAERQGELLVLWRSFTTQVSSESIERSPWRCKDQDDQIFLDLAFTLKPAWLIPKDHQVLKFRKRAARDGVIITSVYTGQ